MNNIPSDVPNTSAPAEPEKPGNWLSKNFMPLLFVAAAIGVVIWKDLNISNTLIVVVGLGLVVFLHELGHFMAAKFCDVHVEAFSIGFGKAIPGCHFKYGETTYKIGYIPLGGYVKMVGEGDNADSDEAEEDPRSFKNKSVYQRMLIISAGVIMNVILGISCFVVAYSHGVEETPGIIGFVGAGSPAWQAGIQGDTLLLSIGGIEKPTFPDIKTKVLSSSRGKVLNLHLMHSSDSASRDVDVIPKREEGELFPLIGIGETDQLTLVKPIKNEPVRVALNGSAADTARNADNVGFQPGDRFIAMTDPDKPDTITDLSPDKRDASGKKLDFFEFRRRMQLLRDKTMVVRVERDGKKIDIPVAPEYTRTLPGIRLQIGRITVLRNGSPATKARPVDGSPEGGLLAVNPGVADSGDKIIAVEIVRPDGQKVRYADIPAAKSEEKVIEKVLDPTRLPYELSEWSESWIRHSKGATDKIPAVRITVMRSPADASQKTSRRCVYDLDWDNTYRFSLEHSSAINSPISLPCLGIAYTVETTIDEVAKGSEAESAGLIKSDVIIAFRNKFLNKKNEETFSEWTPLKQHQGAAMAFFLTRMDIPEVELKIRRAVDNEKEFQEMEFKLTAVRDNTWPQNERGFRFDRDTRTQKADGLWEAVQFGGQRTVRGIRNIYQQLYSLISGNISVKSMNGPLSIADISYKIVGYDTWTFIIFIGMISLNLAVVNFLPIPMLDGGHMTFLIYEKIRGKPAPEKLMEWSLYVGLGLILSLMSFVIYLDIKRLFFS